MLGHCRYILEQAARKFSDNTHHNADYVKLALNRGLQTNALPYCSCRYI